MLRGFAQYAAGPMDCGSEELSLSLGQQRLLEPVVNISCTAVTKCVV